MQFIKKKNILEREVLLYTPVLHWMSIVKPLIRLLLINIIFYTAWAFVSPLVSFFFSIEIIYLILLSFVIFAFEIIRQIYKYQNTEYGVTNQRLMIKRGTFRIITTEIPTDRIESIYCLQSFFGRIFGYGSICINGTGGMMPVFYMVHKPYALRRKIADVIEKNKVVNVIHGDLPKPRPVEKTVSVIEDSNMWGTFVRMTK